jgi:hypothetical protein
MCHFKETRSAFAEAAHTALWANISPYRRAAAPEWQAFLECKAARDSHNAMCPVNAPRAASAHPRPLIHDCCASVEFTSFKMAPRATHSTAAAMAIVTAFLDLLSGSYSFSVVLI